MAGFNMSGDLKRPASDIPLGSLAAIAISWFLYIVFVFLLGAICSREFLRYEFMIAEKVSLVGFLFLLGLYISSLASCMGGLYGAPRILQCIAQEKVIPALAFLAHGKGPNKTPVAAICLTGALTMAFVFIGQVNILAPIVTINFMLTYSAVDYSYFSVTMSYGLQRGPQKSPRVGPRTPSSAQPLILDKSKGYGSNGTLLEFTRDMDQLFRAGDAAAADQPQEPDPKRAKKPRRARKPAKETLQDSFQLDFQERPEDAAPVIPPAERAPYPPEGAEEPDDQMRAEGQMFTEDPQSGAERKEDLNIQNKSLGFEIQSLSASFYSKLCNHWVSFLGAILSIVIMFVIQWIYALTNIAVAVLLYFYIGRVSPGLNPGVAANFSFFSWIRVVAATACRKKPPLEEHFVVTPSFASVGMETTQLTEENADFASRGRFHHSSLISRGQFLHQFN